MSERKVKPWDLLRKENYTEQDIAAARMEVCKACPQLSPKNFCGFCHCYMPTKTKLRAAYCPVRLW